MQIFDALVQKLGGYAKVDLDIYHCEPGVFASVIKKKSHLYDYYLVMAHFKNEEMHHVGATEEALTALSMVPKEKLIILDRDLESIPKVVSRIVQDFERDVYSALSAYLDKIKKYKKIILAYPSKSVYPYPIEIVKGFKRFCIQNQFDYEVLDEIYEGMELQQKDLFITIEETDLVNLVKQTRDGHLTLGEDIGIISYNDTPLKDLLGITVISTDFKKMGTAAAQVIMEGKKAHLKNDFSLIDRHSM